MLYWCGLRIGELLALTRVDIDLKNKEVSITKSYVKLNGTDIITDPKTESSVRTVSMPDCVVHDVNVYFMRHRKIKENDRVFTFSHMSIDRALHKCAAKAGIHDIRLHDLRHSFVSLLINNGFTAYEVGQCVGHSGTYITYRYAHLFNDTKHRILKKPNELGRK